MALDFPASPTDGQTYQGYTYSSFIGAWQAKPAAQSPFFTGATPPANPVAGDSWFNTNDGTMYVYYYDGNTYQWVEHRSQIAKNQVGLVPITPTSVSVSSGTASVSSSGLVTFASDSLIIDGIFTQGFDFYKIFIYTYQPTASYHVFRFRKSDGTEVATSYYGAGYSVGYATTLQGTGGRNNANEGVLNNNNITDRMSAEMTVYSAPAASYTANARTSCYTPGNATLSNHGYNIGNQSLPITGIRLFTNTGTASWTGKISVYGVKN